MQNTSIIVRPLLLTIGILLIPFFGNIYVDGWDWHWTAFAFFGVVLFCAGLVYELAGKYAKTGVISGFIFGEVVAGGLIATLRYLNPNDDVAGVVIITFLISGLFFAFVGYLIQSYFKKKFMIMQNTKRLIVWAVVVALILLIPILMQFPYFTNEVQWNEAIAYIVILLAVGGVYELWQWLKTRDRIYRIAFGVGLAGVFLLGWVSGAVGIIGSENNSVNLMYWTVPAIGLIGSLISRFNPRGMALTLFAVALIQFLIPVIALIITPGVSWGNAGVIGVFVVNSIFAALFVVSALLFRRASTH